MKNFLSKIFIKCYLQIFHSEKIIQVKDGKLYISGKEASEEKIYALAEQAGALKSNAYLNLVLNTIRKHAEEQILYKGKTIEIVHNNRMVIYTIGEIEKLIRLPQVYKKSIEDYK